MQAVAAGHEAGVDDAQHAVRIHHGGSASGKFRHQIQQADSTQHRAAERRETLIQAALCLPLRNHQQERVGAVDGVIRQPNQVAVHIGKYGPASLEPVVDHRIGNLYPTQVFQGARLYEARPGVVRCVGKLVDDNAIHAQLLKAGR